MKTVKQRGRWGVSPKKEGSCQGSLGVRCLSAERPVPSLCLSGVSEPGSGHFPGR